MGLPEQMQMDTESEEDCVRIRWEQALQNWLGTEI
jgi:hypothetical protein